MFCENCGKSLIRGYQFCLECGTPVPAEANEDKTAQETSASETMPGVEPISSEDGKLVFCQNCGMRMQQSTAYCEQCGLQLQSSNQDSGYSNLPSNNGVPLWNTERIDYGYENITDSELEQINNFMSGGGIAAPEYDMPAQDSSFGGMDAVGGIAEDGGALDVLNSQYANLCKSDNDNAMPAIGAQDNMINNEVRKVENFAMDASYVDSSFVDEGALPVIEGASMDFDPDEPEPEDPNTFEMTPEPIQDITPSYIAPTYEEPAAEETIAEEPIVPVYEEPVAPVYEEPAADEMVAEEPAVPVYEEAVEETCEPAYTIPVYSEDDAAPTEAAVYSEEASGYSADIPLYSDPTAEPEAAVSQPAAPSYEVPVYEEPEQPAVSATDLAAAATIASAIEDDGSSMTVMSGDYSQPTNSYTPVADNYATNSSYSEPAPVSEPIPEQPEADLGKLVYCRNCGQDMYEKELVCKNCGAPKRPEYQPRKQYNEKTKGEPFKLFGIFSIPALVVAALVLVFLCFLIVPSMLKGKEEVVEKPSTSQVDNGSTGNTEKTEPTTAATTTADTTTTASESDVTEPVVEEPAELAVSVTSSDKVETREPVEVETAEAEVKEESSEAVTPAATTTTTKATTTRATTTTKPTTTTAATTATTTTKATTTTTKATTTQKPQQAYAPSATVKAQNKERDALISAYETIAAEVGKLQVLYLSTEMAIAMDSDRTADVAGKSFYARDFAASMIKSIKSGKSTVASAVSAAKPTSSELSGAYNGLTTLQSKYEAYYDYIVNVTSFGKYSTECAKYYSAFCSTAKTSFALSKLNTSAQTAVDQNEYYADVLSEAVAAVDNAVSAYTTLYTKVTALSDSTFSTKVTSTLTENMSTYLKAAKYTQAVASYCDILSSAPSAYSTAYSQLKSAYSSLNQCLELFVNAQYDSLSNFKSASNTCITSASSAASKAKSYL